MKTKKNKICNNLTKKCKPSQTKLEIYCRKHANTFNSFETQYENQLNVKIQKNETDIESKLIKLFKTPFTPSKYTAKNDYYTYINYKWISDKTKEFKDTLTYYVQIDSFRITQEKVYYELIDITKEYIKNNNSPKSNSIKCVYNSLYNLNNKSAENFIKNYLKITY